MLAFSGQVHFLRFSGLKLIFCLIQLGLRWNLAVFFRDFGHDLCSSSLFSEAETDYHLFGRNMLASILYRQYSLWVIGAQCVHQWYTILKDVDLLGNQNRPEEYKHEVEQNF